MKQLNLFGEPEVEVIKKLPIPSPIPGIDPVKDGTIDKAIESMEETGWVIEFRFMSNLPNADEIPDGIDRTFLNAISPSGERLALCWDFERKSFFTQVELWGYLYKNDPNYTED